MESRMSRIEAILPTLARKEDLALLDCKLSEKISNLEFKVEAKLNAFEIKVETKLNAFDTKITAVEGKLTALIHKEIAAASWRMIIWATGVVTISFSGAFFIARYIN